MRTAFAPIDNQREGIDQARIGDRAGEMDGVILRDGGSHDHLAEGRGNVIHVDDKVVHVERTFVVGDGEDGGIRLAIVVDRNERQRLTGGAGHQDRGAVEDLPEERMGIAHVGIREGARAGDQIAFVDRHVRAGFGDGRLIDFNGQVVFNLARDIEEAQEEDLAGQDILNDPQQKLAGIGIDRWHRVGCAVVVEIIRQAVLIGIAINQDRRRAIRGKTDSRHGIAVGEGLEAEPIFIGVGKSEVNFGALAHNVQVREERRQTDLARHENDGEEDGVVIGRVGGIEDNLGVAVAQQRSQIIELVIGGVGGVERIGGIGRAVAHAADGDERAVGGQAVVVITGRTGEPTGVHTHGAELAVGLKTEGNAETELGDESRIKLVDGIA